MFKLTLPWHITFFNDFHWFSMTFPGKMPFFQVNIKFNDFSSLGLNSMTFPGLFQPCQSICLLFVSRQLKIQGQGQGQGHTQWSQLRPSIQSIFWLFVSRQSDHFCWDIANSIFDLENSRSRSWPRSHLRPSVQSICLLFVSWQSDHFWLRYSKFHIWPWKLRSRSQRKFPKI